MSNVRIQSNLTISKVESTGAGAPYRTPNPSFSFDMAGSNGPTPGSVLIDTAGTDISFAQLTEMGGPCQLSHLGNDSANFVTYGIWDSTTSRFFPLGELRAGETYNLRLSRFLLSEFGLTGTGTISTDQNTLRMYAWITAVRVFVGAFDP